MQVQIVAETVTVTGTAPVVDTTKSEVSGVVTQQQMETLPINSRQYLSLALLMPGTSMDSTRAFFATVNVGGSVTFNSTGNLVDGVINNFAEDGEPRQNLPEDAVEEFKVSNVQYKAEFGLATGGIVQVVTKSGTNNLHGTAFEYFRDKSLNALGVFETEKPAYRRNQFGGSVGGPLVRDRDPLLRRRGADQGRRVLHRVHRAAPVLLGARGHVRQAVHAQPLLRPRRRTALEHAIVLRPLRPRGRAIDLQQLRRHHLVHGRLRSGDAAPGGGARPHLGARHAAAERLPLPVRARGVLHLAGRHRNLDRHRRQLARRVWRGSRGSSTFPALTYGSSNDQIGPESRWQFKDTYAVTLTAHDLKFGVDISHMPYQYESTGNPLGTYTFSRDQYFDPNDPASIAALTGAATFSASVPPVTTSHPNSYYVAFVQDDWKLRDNVTVNLGLRYERLYGAANEDLDPSVFPIAIPYIDVSERGDTNNFGPRAGVAWDVVGTGRTVVRGGYGLYYGHVRILGNLSEFRNYQQFSVNITNPSYPDPYGGRDPLSFIVSAPANITVVDNDYVQPYSNQYNLGVSQQLFGEYGVHVDAVFTNTDHDRKILDINARVPGAATRPDPTFARVDRNQSTGSARYRALYAKFDKRFSRRHQFLVTYTYMRSRDNAPLGRYLDPFLLDLDWGPSNGERRHAVVASGSVLLPFDITLGAVWTDALAAAVERDRRPRSSTPTASTPIWCRARRAMPAAATLDLAAVNAWRAANGRAAIAESQIESSRINLLDLRASKAIRFGASTKIDLMAQLFNAVQHRQSAGAVRRRARDQRPVRHVRPHHHRAARPSGRARRSPRSGKEDSMIAHHCSFDRPARACWRSPCILPCWPQPARTAGAAGRRHLPAALGRRRADLAGRPHDRVLGHQQRPARSPLLAGLADGRGDGHQPPARRRQGHRQRAALLAGRQAPRVLRPHRRRAPASSSPTPTARRRRSIAPVEGTNHPLPSSGDRLTWSPDGRQLAFISARPGPEEDANGDPMVITRYLYKPTASEGGTRANDNRRLHIFVADVASKAVRQLTDGDYYEHSIDWSPKGDEILFVSNRGPDPDRFFNYDVFAVAGRVRHRAPHHRHEERRVLPEVVARRTLRRLQRHQAAAHLLGDDDGGYARVGDGCRRRGRREVGTIDNRQGAPEWSRDGRHLYFTMQERGQVRLMRVPQGGGAPERLVAERGSVGAWTLAADGTVAYAFTSPASPGGVVAACAGRPGARR